MPLSHVHKVFAVEDAKVAFVTADAAGAATTYGSVIDLPGVKSVEFSGTLETKRLRGDNSLLDSDAVLVEAKIKVEHAKLSLDVFAGFLGLTVVDSGTTPNQKATIAASIASGAIRPKPFKFEAKTPSGGIDVLGGDLHLVFYKAILDGFPDMGLAEEDYQTFGFEAVCMPQNGTGQKWFDLVANETAVAIT